MKLKCDTKTYKLKSSIMSAKLEACFEVFFLLLRSFFRSVFFVATNPWSFDFSGELTAVPPLTFRVFLLPRTWVFTAKETDFFEALRVILPTGVSSSSMSMTSSSSSSISSSGPVVAAGSKLSKEKGWERPVTKDVADVVDVSSGGSVKNRMAPLWNSKFWKLNYEIRWKVR